MDEKRCFGVGTCCLKKGREGVIDVISSDCYKL